MHGRGRVCVIQLARWLDLKADGNVHLQLRIVCLSALMQAVRPALADRAGAVSRLPLYNSIGPAIVTVCGPITFRRRRGGRLRIRRRLPYRAGLGSISER